MALSVPAARQTASVEIAIGAGARARIAADLTAGGILAIGGLIGAILLSTAVLVRVAIREGKRRPSAPASPPAARPPSP